MMQPVSRKILNRASAPAVPSAGLPHTDRVRQRNGKQQRVLQCCIAWYIARVKQALVAGSECRCVNANREQIQPGSKYRSVDSSPICIKKWAEKTSAHSRAKELRRLLPQNEETDPFAAIPQPAEIAVAMDKANVVGCVGHSGNIREFGIAGSRSAF